MILFFISVVKKVTSCLAESSWVEKWIQHYDPERKCQCIAWKHPRLTVKKMFIKRTTAGNLCLQFLGVTVATVGMIPTEGFTSGQGLIQSDAA
jgi:hypothetical protein